MKKYFDTVSDDSDYYEDTIYCAKLDNDDVADCLAEFALFNNNQGRIYRQSEYKNPPIWDFFKLYFGEYDEGYIVPHRYILPINSNLEAFVKIVKKLEFCNRLKQEYCEVVVNNNIIDIIYGYY